MQIKSNRVSIMSVQSYKYLNPNKSCYIIFKGLQKLAYIHLVYLHIWSTITFLAETEAAVMKRINRSWISSRNSS